MIKNFIKIISQAQADANKIMTDTLLYDTNRWRVLSYVQ